MRTKILATAMSCVAATVVLLPAQPGRAEPATPQLTATLLALPDGAGSGRVQGMNNLGELVGEAYFPVSAGWISKPVRWSSPTSAPILLELPAGTTRGIALAINESGIAVGTAEGTLAQAVTWTRGGKATPVMPSTTHHTGGQDINERGDVAGSMTLPNGPTRPGRFSGGTFTPAGQISGEATGIADDSGSSLVGHSYDEIERAFHFNSTNGLSHLNQAGAFWRGLDISSSGRTVIAASYEAPTVLRRVQFPAPRWIAQTFPRPEIVIGGEVVRANTVQTTDISPNGDTVVGVAYFKAAGNGPDISRIFRIVAGTLEVLPTAGRVALAVNDAGVLAGLTVAADGKWKPTVWR